MIKTILFCCLWIFSLKKKIPLIMMNCGYTFLVLTVLMLFHFPWKTSRLTKRHMILILLQISAVCERLLPKTFHNSKTHTTLYYQCTLIFIPRTNAFQGLKLIYSLFKLVSSISIVYEKLQRHSTICRWPFTNIGKHSQNRGCCNQTFSHPV